MIVFAGLLLIALALFGITLPWWSPRFAKQRGLARPAANVAVYEERLAQLAGEVAAGTLSASVVDDLKREMAARLLADTQGPPPDTAAPSSRRLPIVLVATLAAFAVAWYAAAGSWRTVALIELAKRDPAAAESLAIDRSIADLEQRVHDNPGDVDAWVWLARGFRAKHRDADAVQALAHASALKGGQDADILTEWGEALGYAQDHSLAGAPAEKFNAALAVAPDHPRALWYAGAAAMQAGDRKAAVEHWQRLLKQDLAEELRRPLEAKVRELGGTVAEAAPAMPGVVLRIAVHVAASLLRKVRADDTLFVYALDPQGPPMPLAARRVPAAHLPDVGVELSDNDSPMPTRKLSSVSRWRVTARISRSGNALPQPGDLEGSVEVDRAAAGKVIALTIDHARP